MCKIKKNIRFTNSPDPRVHVVAMFETESPTLVQLGDGRNDPLRESVAIRTDGSSAVSISCLWYHTACARTVFKSSVCSGKCENRPRSFLQRSSIYLLCLLNTTPLPPPPIYLLSCSLLISCCNTSAMSLGFFFPYKMDFYYQLILF